MDDFLETLNNLFVAYNTYVGSYAIMAFLIPIGAYFTIRFKFLHVIYFSHALKIITGKYDNPNEAGDISHFKALATALSATVGTGNIAGVALAIYWGGPGAVFWMWVTGFLGMINKFVECTLSHKYRTILPDGSTAGGPMYYMEKGLKDRLGPLAAKILAVIFALGTILCSLGTGNTAQTNSIAGALGQNYGFPHWITGLVVSILIFLVIVGGIKRIAQVTSRLLPFMAIFYLVFGILIIVLNLGEVPGAFLLILKSAFTPVGAMGGFVGSTFLMTLRFGLARGLFSNEAGQGSAAIAHAAAKTRHPAREGLVASVGPFVDTLLICTITALVIILTDNWTSGLKGVSMTSRAFATGLEPLGIGFLGDHVVTAALLLFAFSTTISWSYYGDRAIVYLIGPKAVFPYRVIYCVFAFFGSIWGIDLVWNFVDMVITVMTIPNLIAMVLLGGVVATEAEGYFREMKKGTEKD